MRSCRASDEAVAAVVGGVVLLLVLGIAIVSVNAFHVPRQGEALELAARETAQARLLDIAADASLGPTAPWSAEIPLRPPPTPPPLLAGIIHAPVRAEGHLAFEPDATRIQISHVTDAPPGGVPSGDPMRVDVGGGRMRVYGLGNATEGRAVGSLQLRVGGHYLDPLQYRLEAGALLAHRAGGAHAVSAPALTVSRGGTDASPAHVVSWRVPVLVGEAHGVAGAPAGAVLFTPQAATGIAAGVRVHAVEIRLDTASADAWAEALRTAIGPRGTVDVEQGPGGRGVVTATILPPPGTPAGAPGVVLDLSSARQEVRLALRTPG